MALPEVFVVADSMHPLVAARTPRVLWIELTSKCPFDCVFCSRKTRRGAGEHMPYRLFKSLVGQVQDPRTFLLNYSGESTVYPDLIPAIRLARSTGAAVELVSALANVSEPLLFDLSQSKSASRASRFRSTPRPPRATTRSIATHRSKFCEGD